MKILVVTHNNNEKSGANRSMLSLLKIWKEYYDLHVIVNESKGRLPEILNQIGIKTSKVKYGWNCVPRRQNIVRQGVVIFREVYKYLCSLGVAKELKYKLEAEKYDLVYSNTSVINFGSILAKELGVPHVWHIREFGKEDFNFIPIINRKKQSDYFQDAKRLIVISNALKRQYDLITDPTKVCVVYNGFEIKPLLYNKILGLTEQINILISGQLSPSKGQNQAIEAIRMLRDKYAVRLYIAGDGDKKYIENALNGFEKENYIYVLGQVEDLYELRKNMHIELVCSKCEAFGRVTIEAMLHSLPVVASQTGANIELIENGKTGIFYENGNARSLAEAIEKLILDEEMRLNIAVSGQKFASGFTINKTAAGIERIFEEIAK